MISARPVKHLTGRAWLEYVQSELDKAGIEVLRLASGAVRLVNGGCRITVSELRYLDPRDLADLTRGR
jgi:hypothetical protein